MMSNPCRLFTRWLPPVAGVVALCLWGAASAAQVTRGPYLQSPAPDRITICWRTDEATTSQVITGAIPEATATPVSVAGMRTDHFVTLSGLQPATRYYYRVQGTPASGTAVDQGGADYWFDTPPPNGSAVPQRIWVIGDSGSHPGYAPYTAYYQPSINVCEAYRSATAAAGKTTALWLMLGDNAYNYGLDQEFQAAVFQKYPAALRNTPLWSAIGNHEIATAGPTFTTPVPYDSIMAFPKAGECGGVPSGSERYYSFDRGNIHFVCLDSTTPGNYNNVAGSGGMMDWLVNDLKATTARWIIAYFHQAPYSVGSHASDSEAEMTSMRANFCPVLEAYGADLVLAGHSHTYERSGLISGHYGFSSTWSETMRRQAGNGSDTGGVNAAGAFVTGPANAGGAYQKPVAGATSGTVYALVGSSGSLANWGNISPALVCPTPHPANLVSLRLMGGLVIETSGERLNARYLDQTAATRDDFTIVKGSTYSLGPPAPAFSAPGSPGLSFPVLRSGATGTADQVQVEVIPVSGNSPAPGITTVQFAAGSTGAAATFTPADGEDAGRFQVRIVPASKTVQPGAAAVPAYGIIGGEREGYFQATPALSWYATNFDGAVAAAADWDADPDGDGVPNLLEYALGGDPRAGDPEILPRGKIENGVFVYRYRKGAGRTDLTIAVKQSSTIKNWGPPGGSDVADGPPSVLGEARRLEIPVTAVSSFLRLEVLLTP